MSSAKGVPKIEFECLRRTGILECAEGKEDTEKSLLPERGRKLTAGRVIA